VAELTALAEAAEAWTREGRRVALATVVEAEGSVYRGVGSKMLLDPDREELFGTLSGGCLEPDLLVAAGTALTDGRVVRVHYDLSEEEMWTLGLGCGGTLTVQVEPLRAPGLPDRAEFWRRVEAEETWIATVAAADGPPRLLAVGRDGAVSGTLGRADLDRAAVAAVGPLLPLGSATALQVAGEALFADVLGPPPPVWLFGAGHDAVPVADLCARVGYRVTVVDPRPAYAREDRFPRGTRVVRRWPHELSDVPIPEEALCLVLHHHMERDAQVLAELLRRKVRYIGVLGPVGRTERLLERAAAEGAPTADAWQRIHAPLGLDLGARGPEEIAVAAVAELLAVVHGRTAGFLSGTRGPLHGVIRT
jgi:xanthine dehydrogenase accessory factor